MIKIYNEYFCFKFYLNYFKIIYSFKVFRNNKKGLKSIFGDWNFLHTNANTMFTANFHPWNMILISHNQWITSIHTSNCPEQTLRNETKSILWFNRHKMKKKWREKSAWVWMNAFQVQSFLSHNTYKRNIPYQQTDNIYIIFFSRYDDNCMSIAHKIETDI